MTPPLPDWLFRNDGNFKFNSTDSRNSCFSDLHLFISKKHRRCQFLWILYVWCRAFHQTFVLHGWRRTSGVRQGFPKVWIVTKVIFPKLVQTSSTARFLCCCFFFFFLHTTGQFLRTQLVEQCTYATGHHVGAETSPWT